MPGPSNGAVTRFVWLIHLVFLLHPETVLGAMETCHEHVYNSGIDGCPPADPHLPILNISIDCDIGKVLMVSRTDYSNENFPGKKFAEIQLESSFINETTGIEEREIIFRDGYKPLQDFPLPNIDLDEDLSYQFTACLVFQQSSCWIMNKQNLSCNPVVQETATSDLIPYVTKSSSIISSTLQSLLQHPYLSSSTIITSASTSVSQHPVPAVTTTSQTSSYSTSSPVPVVKQPSAETAAPSNDDGVIIIVSIIVPGVIVGFGVVVVLVVCFIFIKGRRIWFKSQEDKTYFETTAYSAIIPIDNLSMTGSIATIYEGVQIEPSLLLHPPPMYTEREHLKEHAPDNSTSNKIGDQKMCIENLKNNANSQYIKKAIYKNEINSSAAPKKHPPLQTDTSVSSINHTPHSRSHTVSCSDEGYLGTMQSLTDDDTMFSEGTSDLDHSMNMCYDENDTIFQENMSTITEAISPMDENHPSGVVWPSVNTQVVPEQNKASAPSNNATDGYIPDEHTSGEAYSTSTAVPLSTEEDPYYQVHEEGQPIKASIAPTNSDGYIPDEHNSGEPSTMTLCTEEDPYYQIHEEGQPIRASIAPTNSDGYIPDEHISGEPSTITLCTEEDPYYQMHEEGQPIKATIPPNSDGYIPDEHNSGEPSTMTLCTEEDPYYQMHEEGQPIKATIPPNSDGYIPDEHNSGEPSTMTLCTEEDPYYQMHEEGQPIKATIAPNSDGYIPDEHNSDEPSTVTLCTEEDPYYRMHEEGMIETSCVKPSFSFDSEECFVSNSHANSTNFSETVDTNASDQESIPITLQRKNTDGYISDNNNYQPSSEESACTLPHISLPIPGKMTSDVTTTIDLTESTRAITKGSNALTLTTNKAVNNTGKDELLPMNIIKDSEQFTDNIPESVNSPHNSCATMATDDYTTIDTGITMPTATPVTDSYVDVPMVEGADLFETDFNHSSVSLFDDTTDTRDMVSSCDGYIAGQGDDTSCGFYGNQRALSNTTVPITDGYVPNSTSNPLSTPPLIDTTDYIDSTSISSEDDRIPTDPCNVSISIEDDYIATTAETRPSCLTTQKADQPSLSHPSKGVSHVLTTNTDSGYISSNLQSCSVDARDSSYFTMGDFTESSRGPCCETSSRATPADHQAHLQQISFLNPTTTKSSQTNTPSEYIKSPSRGYITSDPTTLTDDTLLHNPQLSTEPPCSGLQDYIDSEPFPLPIDTDTLSIPSHQHYHTTTPCTVQNWTSPSNDGYIS